MRNITSLISLLSFLCCLFALRIQLWLLTRLVSFFIGICLHQDRNITHAQCSRAMVWIQCSYLCDTMTACCLRITAVEIFWRIMWTRNTGASTQPHYICIEPRKTHCLTRPRTAAGEDPSSSCHVAQQTLTDKYQSPVVALTKIIIAKRCECAADWRQGRIVIQGTRHLRHPKTSC